MAVKSSKDIVPQLVEIATVFSSLVPKFWQPSQNAIVKTKYRDPCGRLKKKSKKTLEKSLRIF